MSTSTEWETLDYDFQTTTVVCLHTDVDVLDENVLTNNSSSLTGNTSNRDFY